MSENPANAEEGAEETVVARSEVEVGHHAKALSFWVIRLAKVGLEHGKVVERGLACLKGPTDFWMKGKRESPRDKLASQYQGAAVLVGTNSL